MDGMLVKVKYFINGEGLSRLEYTYYSEEPLSVGDVVTVPVKDTTARAKVTAVDIPESDVATFKDKLKTIPAGAKVQPTLKTAKEIVERMPVIDDPVITEALRNREIESGEVHIDDMIPPSPHLSQPDSDMPVTLTLVNPRTDVSIIELGEKVNALVTYANKRVIASGEDVRAAADDLGFIARLTKAIEEKRDGYVRPHNEYVKEVNIYFKLLSDPLAVAEKITKQKVLAYNAEQERKRKEAEEINRQKIELARREAELSGTGEFTVDTEPLPVPAAAPKTVRASTATLGTRSDRKWRLVDKELVPEEYKILNELLINNLVRNGIPKIPGIEIYLEDNLSVRATR